MSAFRQNNPAAERLRNAFVTGWNNAGGYIGDIDTATPWCCPWEWNETITVSGSSMEEFGADWWRQCEQEVRELC